MAHKSLYQAHMADGRPSGTVAERMASETLDIDLAGARGLPAEERAFAKALLQPGKPMNAPEGALLRKCEDERFTLGDGGVVMPKSMTARLFGPRWAEAMGLDVALAGKALTTAADAALVPRRDIPGMVWRLPAPPGIVLDRATIIPIQEGHGTSAYFPRLVQTDAERLGGIDMEWISEGAQKPEHEPDFAQVEIPCYELAGYVEVTQGMVRRAPNLEALLTGIFRDAARDVIGTACLTGSGIGRPTGVVNTAGVHTVARAGAGTVAYADLVNLKHALEPEHRGPNAGYVMCDAAETVFDNAATLTQPAAYLNYAHHVTARAPALGSDGDLAFADWSKYVVAMASDFVVKSTSLSPETFRQNLVAFAFYMLVGGLMPDPRAAAILVAAGS